MADKIINTPVTITVASIKPVQPGKKQGAVYDISGQRWGVWGNQLDKFTEGGVYKILSYKEGEFMGSILKTVGDFEYVGAPTPATQKANNAARANGQGAAPVRTGMNDAENIRRRDIMISVLINNSEADPSLMAAEELAALLLKFKTAWDMVLGPDAETHAAPQPAPVNRNADMSDDIPF